MQDQAQVRHQEVLNLIETMSSSDLASSMYSGSYTSSNSISMLPAEPKIFYGRDSELADTLKLFDQGTPRIAILGAGGMGKTSLARAVLHHEQIITKYRGNRFFIACDTASSKVELAGLIGAHLGMKPGKDLTQAVLRHLSDTPPSLLILDNLETLWEPVESRKDIEEFLSLLADITSLALLVTMRGAERPAKVQWTRPFLMPLQPLTQDAARKMFIDIADDEHSMEEVDQILYLTDNMPLAISLLAHLVDIEDCGTILARWETEKTSLISEGHDRRSNLELSISLSLSSPRISSMPHSQDLLALLSILPDGLSDVELKQSKFPIQDILGCKTALLRTALAYMDDHKRLKVLVPVREYMGRCFPPTDKMITPLLAHFHELLELYVTAWGKESGAFPIARITSNYTNIQNVLQWSLQLEHPNMAKSIYCACDFSQFSRRIGHEATVLMKDINYLLPSLHDHRLKTYFIVELFNSSISDLVPEPEMLIAQALDHLKHLSDPELECSRMVLHSTHLWHVQSCGILPDFSPVGQGK
ncbi:P-loop containing nucleoside triphosphate hydrolase protein [Mycena metata]|uniref:P-loop containing nucleoside triphosphate hydrolase protein n=1 Tax=Mycena metata TaxID=1033252 RepID=A0AAD7GRS1_9AGAR|nr:P-loop containing nucleoside triphosphate hydrolase protein [Mycena metata]